MEPDDTIDAIREKETWTLADVERLRALTVTYPNDSYLWDVLGDIAQMVDSEALPDDFSLQCYLAAVAADPSYSPAHESLGHWYDLAENFPLAQRHFLLALEHEADDSIRVALASVLAQMGLKADAFAELDRCEDQDAEIVLEMRHEIAEGYHDPDNGDELTKTE
jgi:tetratricopeptide (TPR) repeat protein